MTYKLLFLLLFSGVMVHAGFAQTPVQAALEETKNLKAYLALSTLQEDSVKAALPVYYTAKANLLQRSNRTAADTRNLQKLHDDLLKRILTDEQYQRYEAVKQQQLQLFKQRMGVPANQ